MLSKAHLSCIAVVLVLFGYYLSPPIFTARERPKQGVMAPDNRPLQKMSTPKSNEREEESSAAGSAAKMKGSSEPSNMQLQSHGAMKELLGNKTRKTLPQAGTSTCSD